MTHSSQPFATRTVSPLRIATRLAVLTALCAALTAGFVGSLAGPDQGAASQVARAPAACRAASC